MFVPHIEPTRWHFDVTVAEATNDCIRLSNGDTISLRNFARKHGLSTSKFYLPNGMFQLLKRLRFFYPPTVTVHDNYITINNIKIIIITHVHDKDTVRDMLQLSWDKRLIAVGPTVYPVPEKNMRDIAESLLNSVIARTPIQFSLVNDDSINYTPKNESHTATGMKIYNQLVNTIYPGGDEEIVNLTNLYMDFDVISVDGCLNIVQYDVALSTSDPDSVLCARTHGVNVCRRKGSDTEPNAVTNITVGLVDQQLVNLLPTTTSDNYYPPLSPRLVSLTGSGEDPYFYDLAKLRMAFEKILGPGDFLILASYHPEFDIYPADIPGVDHSEYECILFTEDGTYV